MVIDRMDERLFLVCKYSQSQWRATHALINQINQSDPYTLFPDPFNITKYTHTLVSSRLVPIRS